MYINIFFLVGANVKYKRIYLDLFSIDFPLTAIASILHRLTGIFLFFTIPFVLYLFKLSLDSESSFFIFCSILNNLYIKLLALPFFFSLIYHFINGIRHIFMDFGFFDDFKSSKLTFIIVFFITIILTIFSLLSIL